MFIGRIVRFHKYEAAELAAIIISALSFTTNRAYVQRLTLLFHSFCVRKRHVTRNDFNILRSIIDTHLAPTGAVAGIKDNFVVGAGQYYRAAYEGSNKVQGLKNLGAQMDERIDIEVLLQWSDSIDAIFARMRLSGADPIVIQEIAQYLHNLDSMIIPEEMTNKVNKLRLVA